MTPIRVLRIIARMNVGGPALQVSALLRHLDPTRFEQRLLVGDLAPGEADYVSLRSPGLEVDRIPGLGRAPDPVADARALAAIVAQIRLFRPQIIHTHTAKAGVLGRAAAVIGGVNLRVHTFHGHLLRGYFSPSVTRGVVLAERGLARVTTRLVAVGQRVRDDLVSARIGRPSQYVVVPPGVELQTAVPKAAARAALGVPADAPVIAYVGRIVPIKRPDRLVAVATALSARFPDLVILVAGDGQGLPEMQRKALPLGDRIRYLGWRPDVETVYCAADVTVLTSDNEGMPLSLIEAATVGCPAVTTNVGSAGEVVLDGVTGFVTDRVPGAIGEATGRLLADPDLRARFGELAIQRARRLFSRERLVADTSALYEEIIRQELPCRPS